LPTTVTRADLLALHFAYGFRAYRGHAPDVRATIERLAAVAADPEATRAAESDAVDALAALLFPDAVEGDAFACRVVRLMRQKGMVQRDLAIALGVSGPGVSRMLSGKHRPRRRTVCRVAAALGVPFDDLWAAEAKGP
jgi:DNA-binding phage protein